MELVLSLGAHGSTAVDHVGGKAANLSILTAAGFPVPPGFCVTTDAYAELLAETGLGAKISSLLDRSDLLDPSQLDTVTGEIAALVAEVDVPKHVATAIADAYRALGADPYVAVRSSGTAEDMADASFAGLHDTYLDIRGTDAVIDAVKRCWTSLWTPRATVYRHRGGFDQSLVRIAVVVQVMVESDVSGVMFTGNPLTTATDEIVINAGWGLGEAIVSGIVTPDQYTVKKGTDKVLARAMGSKELRIVRDGAAGSGGTTTQNVADRDRGRFTLTDRQIARLAELGTQVEAHYADVPQDLEWALSDGHFHLLQSRPITGVEFSWDADVEAGIWGDIPEDEDTVWTRTFADEITTGAVSPLTYSVRYPGYSRQAFGSLTNLLDSDYAQTRRMFKYHKGEVYCDTRWARILAERMAWSALRPEMLGWADPRDREAIIAAPFNRRIYLKFLLRVLSNRNMRPNAGVRRLYGHWRSPEVGRATAGLPEAELRLLSDAELQRYTERMKGLEDEFGSEITLLTLFWLGGSMSILEQLVARWYDGADENAYLSLISGCTQETDTLRENAALWDFAQRIRHSPVLRATFEQHEGAAFFEALTMSEEGRAFLADYEPWNRQFGHRGEADRDMIYPRRSEDPGLDYQAIRAFLRADASISPDDLWQQTKVKRESALNEVLTTVRKRRFGRIKAGAIDRVYHLMHRYIAFRDDQRQNPTDLIMMSYKRGFLEAGRRLHERGLLQSADDVHYLSKSELFDLLHGHRANLTLVQAKITARRRDVERMIRHEIDPPKLLHRGRAVDLEETVDDGSGRWAGTPVSSGAVTGRARIVHRLADIVDVQQGEILVVHATDPGWTSVFLLIRGIVIETGGPLAHAACLAREYGLPAVQVEKATRLIPDGATITVDGSSGVVRVVADADPPQPDEE